MTVAQDPPREVLRREGTIRPLPERSDRATGNGGEGNRRYEVAFASEYPVERYFGREVLDVSSEAINLERVEAGTMSVLVDHDARDLVGTVERISIGSDSVARAVVRLGKNARAQEVRADVDDGIRTGISFGYRINRMVLDESSESDGDTYRVVEWTPVEISFVSIPADPTVGVGRSYEVRRDNRPDPVERLSQAGEEAVKAETRRVSTIWELGQKHGLTDLARKAIDEEWEVVRFTREIIDHRAGDDAGSSQYVSRAAPSGGGGLGLSQAEVQGYSVMAAVEALESKDWRNASFERSCSDELEKRLPGRRSLGGVLIPPEVFAARAITTTGAGAGLQYVEHHPEAFIDALRPHSRVLQLGARTLMGLEGDVSIPRQTGTASVQWVAEEVGVSAADIPFDAVSMSPKTAGARADVSRKARLQSSPDVDALVLRDIRASLGAAVDLMAMTGSGTGAEPRGVLNEVGVGLVAIGANGGAPTFDHAVALENEVAIDDADTGTLGYLTNAQVRSKWKRTQRFAGTDGAAVWEAGGRGDFDIVNGRRAASSNHVPANLTKGTGTNLSAVLFGNWSDLLIGEWGILELQVDPHTKGDSGGLVLRGFLDVDIALRHPESFAVIVDADPS